MSMVIIGFIGQTLNIKKNCSFLTESPSKLNFRAPGGQFPKIGYLQGPWQIDPSRLLLEDIDLKSPTQGNYSKD